jgi:hypothetical protein
VTLSNDNVERIALLYHAAKRNGSLVSVRELSRLLREGASESDVEEAITSLPLLSSRFMLMSGYLAERTMTIRTDSFLSEADNRRVAKANLSHASRFVSLIHSSKFSLVAVSGSTSYGSAAVSRDADLFCVAPSGKMWVSLARSLVMARAHSIVARGSPDFCLSCVMDEAFARGTFERQRSPLFARDALEAKVLRGRDLYESLMRTASWISDYYPVAYREAITPASKAPAKENPSAFERALNSLLFKTLGRYIQLKSALFNRRLMTAGRSGDMFRVRCGEDHLIYESRRYVELRKEYELAEQKSSGTSFITS